jgi:hypothetical protein
LLFPEEWRLLQQKVLMKVSFFERFGNNSESYTILPTSGKNVNKNIVIKS